MSDPVPNDDVDGVLSSIRRLVAENPDVTRVDGPSAPGAEGSRHAGKFVLTDALRVVEPAAETSARSQVMARHGLLRDLGSVATHAVSPDARSARPSPERPAAPVVLTGPTFATSDDRLNTGDSAGGVSDMIRAELARAVDEVVSAADAVERDAGQITDEPSRTWTAAAAHDMRSRTDLPGADVETAQDQRPAAAPLALDEEALSRLIADIVRAELQGALGERITRNVRKLVRHEVHRALSSQNIN